jgi:hypothetical protein
MNWRVSHDGSIEDRDGTGSIDEDDEPITGKDRDEDQP